MNGTRLAITADSFVVSPLRFPGGSIGELAVNGTVNDLAVRAPGPKRWWSPMCSKRACRRRSWKPKFAPWPRRARRRRHHRGRRHQGRGARQGRPHVHHHRGHRPAHSRRPMLGAVGAARRRDPAFGADRRSRHHHSAGARRTGSGSRPLLRYALRCCRWWKRWPKPRRPGCAGCAIPRAAAWPPLNEFARDCGLGVFLSRRPHSRARRGARRVRVAGPRSAAHRQRRAVPGGGGAGVCRCGARSSAARRRAATKRGSSAKCASSRRARSWSSTPLRRHAGSSTCWWAIRCRGSARGPTPMAHLATCRLRARGGRRAASPRAQSDLRGFFAREARRLARACRAMAERFLRGGRLLAFGRGPYATDAQHVSVEFVHPVIVGKRALPALDLSVAFRPWLEAILQPEDIVMGFGPPEGDPEVSAALGTRAPRGAMTLALPGAEGDYCCERGHRRSVHPSGSDRDSVSHAVGDGARLPRAPRTRARSSGDAGFLYPFLGAAEAGHRRSDRGGGRLHSHEGRGRRPAARADGRESCRRRSANASARHSRARWRAAAS